MTERGRIEAALRGLYDARARSDLDGLCRHFCDDGDFQIAGASHASPIAVIAVGIAEFRPWLALMLRTFQLSELTILSMIVEDAKAAVHWRARIHSRITGQVVLTELVDLLRLRADDDGEWRIASYTEFFVPR